MGLISSPRKTRGLRWGSREGGSGYLRRSGGRTRSARRRCARRKKQMSGWRVDSGELDTRRSRFPPAISVTPGPVLIGQDTHLIRLLSSSASGVLRARLGVEASGQKARDEKIEGPPFES